MDNDTRMQQDTELLASHHTALATWALRHLGASILIATIIGALCVAGMGASGALIGVIVFGVCLLFGTAPKPGRRD